MKYLKPIALLFFFATLTEVQAQEAIPAAGGKASGSGGSVSYTVGQAAYTTNTGTTGTVTQGIQQPFEISVVSGLEEAKSICLAVSVYPNPTTDYLILSMAEFDISNLSYQVYNINGNLLQSEKITENQTLIGMSTLMPATYFLKVTQGNIQVKTFKIIKN